ncbi:hypothetical protein MMIC_P0297 [Mariprofundus micogutta]|uniref:Methyltransferase domain-containing protein n=1 Tax=Mariprofundus micogutta TaxID=1921010 RepID=A0A1L8CKD1_9PROT|nr:class I SAM-dependent methyltransferase [Mariprofundus micogutta]GAV19363.1 hypothetical protein MMIC_P0297 [Mariprofundus micogutta]
MNRHFLSGEEIKAFYDQFGSKQDWQKFYEGPAIRTLLGEGAFDTSDAILEFGCGTGSFAEELLIQYLPETASYLGIDISSTMVNLARQKLSPFKNRANIEQTTGSFHFDLETQSIDHFVSNYVLDLLSPEDIKTLLNEAHRLLKQDGHLCLLSLTHGQTIFSKMLTRTWGYIHRLRPSLVGGCRPINLLNYLSDKQWRIDYQHISSAFAIPSQIIIASKI